MKIAYLATQFPHHTQTFVLNEVEAHHRHGVDILPLSCCRVPDDGPVSALGRAWGRQTVRPRGRLSSLVALAHELIGHPTRMFHVVLWLAGLTFIDVKESLIGGLALFTAASLAPACRARSVQLIHVHFASRSLTTGVILGRLVGIPVSCTVHAFEIWGRGGRNLRYRLKECAFVAAESQYHIDYLRNKCGNETARLCQVVHNGIDRSEFDATHRKPIAGRILLISRFAEKKGHRYLVEACAILRERNVPCECVLVGVGPESKRIQRQVEQLGLDHTITIVGAVANDQLAHFLNTAHVFVLPAVVASNGDRDGVPVALIEAMACGVPVVSTRVAGIPELLRNGRAGCLVPARNAPALADQIERLLTDKRLATKLAAAGRRAVEEEFDILKTTKSLQRLFSEVIGTPRQATLRAPIPASSISQTSAQPPRRR